MKEITLDDITAPISIVEHLTDVFTNAIASALPDLPNAPEALIAPGTNAKFGDYQCNSSMQLAGLLKGVATSQGSKPSSPRDIATKILENLPKSPLIEKCDIAGPGFINIYLTRAYAEKVLSSLLLNGIQPPKQDLKTVVVDFSSPNIGKENFLVLLIELGCNYMFFAFIFCL